jgi:hypothetical protein
MMVKMGSKMNFFKRFRQIVYRAVEKGRNMEASEIRRKIYQKMIESTPKNDVSCRRRNGRWFFNFYSSW